MDTPSSGTSSGLRPFRTPADGIHEGPRELRRLPDEWEERPYRHVEVVPLARTIGAEIRGLNLSRPVGAELRAELNRALLEWKVLFFRGQHLSRDQQREFAAHWGELASLPLVPTGGHEAVSRFDDGPVPHFENVWHTDVTFRERPTMGSVLQVRQIPPFGGDTLWADMAAAYDNLPDTVKERIEHATAVHDYVPGFARYYTPAQLLPFQELYPPVEHPVVRRHPETGRRSLFVHLSYVTHIVGMEPAESDRLLRFLFLQAHVPEFQVRFHWQAGDIAFWDNRTTAHYAVNDYAPHPRVAERVSIEGDKPV
ncbi:taurine dioxygenase [Streptomyces aureoverticillatus]|nr:taurine dioxygenase [Streptomyces aureoverticillatus]